MEYEIHLTFWVTAADLNGDGKLDLAVVNSLGGSGGVTVFPGNGDGTFGSGAYYPIGQDTTFVAVGDFNGDGKKDLATINDFSSAVNVLLNTGVVAFSPTKPLNFRNQKVGSKSAAQKVTLTNTGKTALKISSMKASSQFWMTSTCHPKVAAGGSCTLSVTFSPTSQGAKTGTVTIQDSASSKPMVIELSGTGT